MVTPGVIIYAQISRSAERYAMMLSRDTGLAVYSNQEEVPPEVLKQTQFLVLSTPVSGGEPALLQWMGQHWKAIDRKQILVLCLIRNWSARASHVSHLRQAFPYRNRDAFELYVLPRSETGASNDRHSRRRKSWMNIFRRPRAQDAHPVLTDSPAPGPEMDPHLQTVKTRILELLGEAPASAGH